MDAAMQNAIRQKQVESFGRLMAGFSHDMKNHLGIIRESNGLMGDLLSMSDLGGDEVLAQRLQKAIDSIEQRVKYGAHMLHHLSGFAHRPDNPFSMFQVNDIIVEACVFLERFTRLQQVGLEFDLQDGLPVLYNDPALVQHVLYRLFMTCLDGIATGGTMTIGTGISKRKEIRVIFCSSGPIKAEGKTEIDEDTLAAVRKLEGDVELAKTDENNSELRLILKSLPC